MFAEENLSSKQFKRDEKSVNLREAAHVDTVVIKTTYKYIIQAKHDYPKLNCYSTIIFICLMEQITESSWL